MVRNQWMETEQAASQARNHYIFNLEQALEVSLQDGLEKQQQVAARDQQLASKDQQLAHKDHAIASLQQQLNDKDQTIRELEQKLKAMENAAHSRSPIGVVSVASSVEDEEKLMVTPVQLQQQLPTKREPVKTVTPTAAAAAPTTTKTTTPSAPAGATASEQDDYKRKYAGGFEAAMARAKELDKRRRMGK